MELICPSGPSLGASQGLPSPKPPQPCLLPHRVMEKLVLVLLPTLGLTWLVGLLVPP